MTGPATVLLPRQGLLQSQPRQRARRWANALQKQWACATLAACRARTLTRRLLMTGNASAFLLRLELETKRRPSACSMSALSTQSCVPLAKPVWTTTRRRRTPGSASATHRPQAAQRFLRRHARLTSARQTVPRAVPQGRAAKTETKVPQLKEIGTVLASRQLSELPCKEPQQRVRRWVSALQMQRRARRQNSRATIPIWRLWETGSVGVSPLPPAPGCRVWPRVSWMNASTTLLPARPDKPAWTPTKLQQVTGNAPAPFQKVVQERRHLLCACWMNVQRTLQCALRKAKNARMLTTKSTATGCATAWHLQPEHPQLLQRPCARKWASAWPMRRRAQLLVSPATTLTSWRWATGPASALPPPQERVRKVWRCAKLTSASQTPRPAQPGRRAKTPTRPLPTAGSASATLPPRGGALRRLQRARQTSVLRTVRRARRLANSAPILTRPSQETGRAVALPPPPEHPQQPPRPCARKWASAWPMRRRARLLVSPATTPTLWRWATGPASALPPPRVWRCRWVPQLVVSTSASQTPAGALLGRTASMPTRQRCPTGNASARHRPRVRRPWLRRPARRMSVLPMVLPAPLPDKPATILTRR